MTTFRRLETFDVSQNDADLQAVPPQTNPAPFTQAGFIGQDSAGAVWFNGTKVTTTATVTQPVFGAKGDAQQYLDASLSQASPIVTTIASRFVSGDVGKLFSTIIPPPTELYTSYTKNDPGSFLTVTATGVSSSAIPQASTAFLYKDYGTGFFSGNLTHFLDIKDTFGGSGTVFDIFWLLSNNNSGTPAAGDIYIQLNSNGNPTLFVLQSGGSVSAGLALSNATQYWLTVALSGTTLTCSVYSNPTRTTLVGTQSIIISGTSAWRYVYAFATAGGTSTATATILSENLNISGLTTPTLFAAMIASFQSPTQVTLNAGAPGAGSGLTFAWGTDNTAPFNAALQSANVQGLSSVSVPPGIYLFSGPISIPDNVTLKGTVPGPFLPRTGIPTNATNVPQLWPTNVTDTAFIKVFVRQNAVANGTNVITGLSDTTKLRVGQFVQIVNGSNVAGLTPNSGGAQITSVDSPSQIHVSQTASFSGACVLTAGVNHPGIEDLLIYHPLQILDSSTATPIAFPPAIQLVGAQGYKIRRVTMMNAYAGISVGWGDVNTYGFFSASGWIEDVYLGVLSIGIAVDHSADVIHVKGVHIWPLYDMFGPNQTTPHDYPTNLDTWVQANGTGLAFYRADQPQLVDIFIFGKNIAVLGTTSPDTNIGNNNGYCNFTNLAMDTVKFGVTVNSAQGPWSINNVSASTAVGVASGGNMLATSNGVKLSVVGGNVITNGWGASALSQGAGSTLVANFILGISFDNVLSIGEVLMGDFGSAPTSAGTAGTAGEIVYHAGILYFCSVTGAAGAATWNKFNLTAV